MNQSKFEEISENLTFLDDWEDRYKYIIELGHELPAFDDAQRGAENKVSGCVSQVWLAIDTDGSSGETKLQLKGDSDAMIVKGLVAILVALYSGQTLDHVLRTDAMALLDQMGLREHLTSQRANGLIAMVERIHARARQLS